MNPFGIRDKWWKGTGLTINQKECLVLLFLVKFFGRHITKLDHTDQNLVLPTNRMGAEKGNVDLYVSQISKDKIWNTTCSTVKSLTSFIFLESLKLLLVLWIFCCCNWTFSIDIIYNFIFHNKHAKSQNVKVK